MSERSELAGVPPPFFLALAPARVWVGQPVAVLAVTAIVLIGVTLTLAVLTVSPGGVAVGLLTLAVAFGVYQWMRTPTGRLQQAIEVDAQELRVLDHRGQRHLAIRLAEIDRVALAGPTAMADLVVTSSSRAICVPRSRFSTQEEMARVVEAVRTRIRALPPGARNLVELDSQAEHEAAMGGRLPLVASIVASVFVLAGILLVFPETHGLLLTLPTSSFAPDALANWLDSTASLTLVAALVLGLGGTLEKHFGKRRFAIVLVSGATLGAIASLARGVDPPLLGVASGALYGVLGAQAAGVYLRRYGVPLYVPSLSVLLGMPMLYLPSIRGFSSASVVGGLVGGAIATAFLCWPAARALQTPAPG